MNLLQMPPPEQRLVQPAAESLAARVHGLIGEKLIQADMVRMQIEALKFQLERDRQAARLREQRLYARILEQRWTELRMQGLALCGCGLLVGVLIGFLLVQ